MKRSLRHDIEGWNGKCLRAMACVLLSCYVMICPVAAEEVGDKALETGLRNSISLIYRKDFVGAASAVLNSGISDPIEEREENIKGLGGSLKMFYEALCTFNGDPVMPESGELTSVEYVGGEDPLYFIFARPHKDGLVYWSYTITVDKDVSNMKKYKLKTINAGDTTKEILKTVKGDKSVR